MLLSEAAKDLGIYLDDLEVVENKKVTLEVSFWSMVNFCHLPGDRIHGQISLNMQ